MEWRDEQQDRPKAVVKDILKNRPIPYSVSTSSNGLTGSLSNNSSAPGIPSPTAMSFSSFVSRFKMAKNPAPPTQPASPFASDTADSGATSPQAESGATTPTRQLRERKTRSVFKFDDLDSQDDGDSNEDAEDAEDAEEEIQQPKRKRRRAIALESEDDMDDDDEYVDEEEKVERRNESVALSDKAIMLRSIFPNVSLETLQKALDQASGSIVLASQIVARQLVMSGEGFALPSTFKNAVTSAGIPAIIPPAPQPMPQRSRLRRRVSSDSSGSDSDSGAPIQPRVSLEEARKMAQTVRFYNTATSQEIQDVTGCKPEQAETLINRLRPFEDLEDLKDKLKRHRGLSEKYITAYVEMMDGYSVVDQIIGNVERLGNELSGTISVWQGHQEESEALDSPSSEDTADEKAGTHLTSVRADPNSTEYQAAMEGYLTEQPACVNKDMTLKSYQLLGVNWMLLLYRKGISGILADEMGLGKTAQVISFLGRLHELGKTGPHLIIVPASTLENWLREFGRFCSSLRVRAYHGTQQERFDLRYDMMEEQDFDVLVTTYNIAAGAKEDRSFLRKLKCKTMILDEGHMIKNCTSARYTNLMSIRVPFRLLLTGTPLQNNLQELVSLLMFIMPDVFLENEDEIRKIFKIKVFTNTETKKQRHGNGAGSRNVAQMLSRQRIARAKKMMTPFVLRRRKADVLKDLPQKVQVIDRCPMTNNQQILYDKILRESKHSFEQAMDARAESKKDKRAGSSFENLSNIVIHLRKAADHPLLFRHIYTDAKLKKMAKEIMKEEKYWDADVNFIFEDMSVMSDFELTGLCEEHHSIRSHRLREDAWMDSGKVQRLKTLLPENKDKGNKVLLFSQFTRMLDILERVMDTLGMRYLRLDGETPVSERQNIIDEFNDDPEINVFLLSTKAGGFGINLTSANVVILYDLDFNPQNDRQAEDRAHRVGQTRDVKVLKLIADNSIEEHILKMAEIKLRLDHSVSNQGDDEDTMEAEEQQKESVHSLLKNALLS